MKPIYFLPVLGMVAAIVFSPFTTSAQSLNSGPTVYANLSHVASSSSITDGDAIVDHASASSASAAAAQAAPEASSGGPFSGIGADVKVGLAGIGFDVATPLVPTSLNLRGGATFFSYNLSETTDDNLNVNGTLKLQNSGIMLDWFPWRNAFRLSGGMTIYNNKGVSGSVGVPNGNSFTLGNDKYYASGPLTGTGDFKLGGTIGGRVSFGTGNLLPKKGRFSFQSELGIEFVSAPTVALAFSGDVCTSAQGANCESPTNVATFTQFQSDVAAEESKLQSDVNFVRFYPILSIGIGFRIH